MDFGRLLADPIMEDTVVKQLFFSSRRYGRFSLHSGRCDACAIRLNIAFFHVFWFPTDSIPIRQRALFGRQIGSPKREHFFSVFKNEDATWIRHAQVDKVDVASKHVSTPTEPS